MQRSTDRILTTHVGSLIRPPELQEFLRARQKGDGFDEAAYDRCLKDSVAAVVRQQADAGVDVVSDGEFGKSISWSQYVLERMSGFERRPFKPGVNTFQRGADRERFAAFYAELDAREGVSTTLDSVCVGPISYTGQAQLQRDIDNFKAALKSTKVTEAFMPVAAPASVIPDRKNEYYKSEEDILEAIANAMRTEYRLIVDAGFLVQLDDARNAVTYDRMVPPGTFADYRQLAGAAGRGDQPCHRGSSARSHSLSRLLGKLARPAYHRRAVEGHRRSDPENSCRCLCDRGRQSASRA